MQALVRPTDFNLREQTMNKGQYLTFKLQNNSYAVGIEYVREINRMSEISEVPEAPTFVAGVMNLRGKVITVIDLRKRLHMPDTTVTKETCVVVVESEMGHVGVIVDSVQAVIQLQENQIDNCPVSESEHAFVKAIGKIDSKLIMLIDLSSCISKRDLMGFQTVA